MIEYLENIISNNNCVNLIFDLNIDNQNSDKIFKLKKLNKAQISKLESF